VSAAASTSQQLARTFRASAPAKRACVVDLRATGAVWALRGAARPARDHPDARHVGPMQLTNRDRAICLDCSLGVTGLGGKVGLASKPRLSIASAPTLVAAGSSWCDRSSPHRPALKRPTTVPDHQSRFATMAGIRPLAVLPTGCLSTTQAAPGRRTLRQHHITPKGEEPRWTLLCVVAMRATVVLRTIRDVEHPPALGVRTNSPNVGVPGWTRTRSIRERHLLFPSSLGLQVGHRSLATQPSAPGIDATLYGSSRSW